MPQDQDETVADVVVVRLLDNVAKVKAPLAVDN
jgi:hypothetical protein